MRLLTNRDLQRAIDSCSEWEYNVKGTDWRCVIRKLNKLLRSRLSRK